METLLIEKNYTKGVKILRNDIFGDVEGDGSASAGSDGYTTLNDELKAFIFFNLIATGRYALQNWLNGLVPTFS